MATPLVWDAPASKRLYETGVDHGVLWVKGNSGYGNPIAWNGLVQVSESPEGAEPTALYADNIKYLNLMSAEEFKFSIEAYTYPDEFMVCDGTVEIGSTGAYKTQQTRKEFCFAYRTLVGSAAEQADPSDPAHYKIHIIFNALASPTSSDYATVNDSPEAMTFSWECTTTPEVSSTNGTTAHLVIDSVEAANKLASFETRLYDADQTFPGFDGIISALT